MRKVEKNILKEGYSTPVEKNHLNLNLKEKRTLRIQRKFLKWIVGAKVENHFHVHLLTFQSMVRRLGGLYSSCTIR